MSAVQLYGGNLFSLEDPDPKLIDIEDVATSLSRICRFGGHCRE